MYPGIRQGKDYFSVNLEKQGDEWNVRPYYYSDSFLNIKIRKLNESEFLDLCFSIKNFLVKLFSSQPRGYNEYLLYDDAFGALWETIRVFDDELLSYAELITATKSGKNIEKFKKDQKPKKD